MSFKIVGLCSGGLEEILKKEVESCKGEIEEVKKGIVQFYGDEEVLYRLNIVSRVGTHFLKFIKNFNFKDVNDIYLKIKKINFDNYFNYDKNIKVEFKGKSKVINNSYFATLRVKDGIVDFFKEKYGVRPSIDKDNPDISIFLYVEDNSAFLYLDSSGVPLFKRGYRKKHSEAPLKEDIASGIILLSGYDGTKDFLDPMCGSGTLIFEAFMIAKNIAPNLERNFAFMNWKDYNEELFLKIKEEEKGKIRDNDIKFIGVDIDMKATRIANFIKKDFFDNNKNITFITGDFRKTIDSFENGFIVTNPPYGERIKIDENISEFYKSIGDFFKKKCKGSIASIFSGNKEAIKSIGLKPEMKVAINNGPIEAKLLKYKMY